MNERVENPSSFQKKAKKNFLKMEENTNRKKQTNKST